LRTDGERDRAGSASEPTLLLLSLSESFSAMWEGLAADAGLLLERLDDVSGFERRHAVAVVAGGGEEVRLEDTFRRIGRPAIDVAAVGALPDRRLATELVRAGAADYFVLPEDMELLRSWLRDNGERLRIRIRRSAFASGEQCKYRFEGILGESAALGTALDQAARVIPHPGVTVLITGETGTGKEVLARAIHYNGPRREAPFVDVNCIALPDQLLESELFGHEKGAFTDASAAKPGLMEEAHGGTLFLDEIGHLPIPLQGKLLRALEERRVRRVGGTRNIPIDVRIIAATHVNLREAVRRGEFREDLYYRLNVMPIELPPLRARRRDILVLARHFLARFTAEYGVQASLSPGAERALVTAAWPGNVRELRNSIERAVLLCDSGTLDAADFSVTDVQAPETERAFELPAPLGDIVRRATVATVDLCGGNKSEAARRLRISRTRLLRILDAADQTSVTASDDAESDLDAP